MGGQDDIREEPQADEGGSGFSGAEEVFDLVAAALSAHDRPKAVRTAVEAVTSGAITIPELYRDVLTSILAATGAAWQRGSVAVWEEHLASASVRTIVEILYPGVLKAKAEAPDTGRSVLLACPPEESHDLGLRMVSDRFDMAGWTTYFLGPDTPVEEIADAAGRLGVHAVVMSSSTHFHRLAVRHAVDYLKNALPNVDVWVGGPAFAGDVAGWLPSEVVDLDALLGDGWSGTGDAGSGHEAAASAEMEGDGQEPDVEEGESGEDAAAEVVPADEAAVGDHIAADETPPTEG
jgi:MerR family transcriptional regulator, light-induced transcriptional regulator